MVLAWSIEVSWGHIVRKAAVYPCMDREKGILLERYLKAGQRLAK